MNDMVTCSVCGKAHGLDTSELTFGLPDLIYALPEAQRAVRCDVSSDICTIDRERFFIRGLLPLRVGGRTDRYCLGVWSEVSSDVFARIYSRWLDPDQAEEPRLPGTLANELPLHEQNSLGLLISIQLTGPKTRPEFYLKPSEHTLYREQTNGIDEHRAIEYSDRKRHGADGSTSAARAVSDKMGE